MLVPPKTLERPSPLKKSRSIYSTLEKYRITSKESVCSTYSIFHHALTIVRLLHLGPPPLQARISHKIRSPPRHYPPSRNAQISNPKSWFEDRSYTVLRHSSLNLWVRAIIYRLVSQPAINIANKHCQTNAVAAVKCGWANDGPDRLLRGVYL